MSSLKVFDLVELVNEDWYSNSNVLVKSVRRNGVYKLSVGSDCVIESIEYLGYWGNSVNVKYVMGKVVKMKMKENKMKFEIIECDGDVKEIVICEDNNGEEIFSMRVVDNVVEIWEGDNVKEVMLEVNE